MSTRKNDKTRDNIVIFLDDDVTVSGYNDVTNHDNNVTKHTHHKNVAEVITVGVISDLVKDKHQDNHKNRRQSGRIF